MSQDEIHKVAQADTPLKVEVPNTIAGLLTWAVGRFGGSAVIALACSYAVIRIYTDMQVKQAEQIGDQKAMNIQVLEIARQATQVSVEVSSSMRELSKAVESNTRAVEEAHRRSAN